MDRFFKIMVCLLLALVVVVTVGLFLHSIFDQSEYAIPVVPFESGAD